MLTISESTRLPITNGLILVDTTDNPVTIYFMNCPVHANDEYLVIRKISSDNNTICLLSTIYPIDDSQIVMFGINQAANITFGLNRSVTLKADGQQWYIIHED